MEFIQGKCGTGFEAACELAFEEAAAGNMSPEVTNLFASLLGNNEPWEQAHRKLKSAIQGRYGRNCTWEGNLRIIPVPELRFDTSPIPQLGINVQAYIVWPGEVETNSGYHSVTLVGPVNKLEALVLPMIFLHAILNDDPGRFRILGRSGSFTIWGIPGAKPVRFSEDFIYELSKIFKRKSVATWLDMFGSQGRSVAPLVIGSLLGLESIDIAQPASVGEQAWDEETIISALEGMAYERAEAKKMFLRVAPKLRVEQALEEVIRITLQEGGKEG